MYKRQVVRHLALTNDDRHVEDIQHLIRVENALADVFEDRCGRTFGEAEILPKVRRIITQGGNILTTTISLQSVVSIQSVPTYLMDEPRVVESDRWFPWGMAADGGYVGVVMAGGWPEGVWIDIEAYWSDQGVIGIPADVREAMTLLTIKTWRRYKSSPLEVVGGDIVAVPTPDGWNDSLVKNSIARLSLIHI